MTLGKYINILETIPKEKIIPIGLGNPHSWRGSYDELSFELVPNITVGEMLKQAKGAKNTTMIGWKGGEFLMTENTSINIDEEGNWSDGETIFTLLFNLMFA